MTATFGSGDYTYRVVDGWAKWPEDWQLGDVAGVGVDGNDRVYAFHRGDHPMVVFDRDGNVLRTWGEGLFKRAHGVHMGPDDTIYLTDEGDHAVRKCTLDGKVLLTIGIPGEAAPFMSGEPFRRCTHSALSPGNDIYVSDGYGNARIHKYAPDGKRIMSWGEPGSGPGQSIFRTTFPAMRMDGSMSPTGKTIASRFSTTMGVSRRSGTTCIGRAGCTCRRGNVPSATLGRSARTTSSIEARRISVRD